MKVIGLCGGSGSGKGMVASIFEEFGIPTIDTDAVYREITSSNSECLRSLVCEFGEAIIDDKGALNRSVLSDIVFNSTDAKEKRDKLNDITHKYILKETRVRLAEYARNGVKAVTVDAPLLFESGFDKECDIIICVIADIELRVARIVARDKISYEKALSRIKAQLSDEYLVSRSNYKIVNNGNVSELRRCVSQIAAEIFAK